MTFSTDTSSMWLCYENIMAMFGYSYHIFAPTCPNYLQISPNMLPKNMFMKFESTGTLSEAHLYQVRTVFESYSVLILEIASAQKLKLQLGKAL